MIVMKLASAAFVGAMMIASPEAYAGYSTIYALGSCTADKFCRIVDGFDQIPTLEDCKRQKASWEAGETGSFKFFCLEKTIPIWSRVE
jgi:hypothetical protein